MPGLDPPYDARDADTLHETWICFDSDAAASATIHVHIKVAACVTTIQVLSTRFSSCAPAQRSEKFNRAERFSATLQLAAGGNDHTHLGFQLGDDEGRAKRGSAADISFLLHGCRRDWIICYCEI